MSGRIAIVGDSTLDHCCTKSWETNRRGLEARISRSCSFLRPKRRYDVKSFAWSGAGYDTDWGFVEQARYSMQNADGRGWDHVLFVGGWNSSDMEPADVRKHTEEIFRIFAQK